MQQFILGIVGYLILLIVWGIICLLVYSISLATKSKKPMQVVLGLVYVVNWVFGILISIYLLYIGWQLLSHGQILWLVLFIMFGAGIVATLFQWIIMPFSIIPAYFTGVLEDKHEKEDVITAEILDEAKKVVDVIEGEKTIDRRLSIYFLLDYAVNFLYVIMHPQQYHMLGWPDYIITPLFFMLQSVILYGVIVLVYNKIRHHKFFYKNKKYWLIRVFQVDIIILVGLQVLAIAYFAILAVTR